MRTSLNEIARIEKYLSGNLSGEDQTLLEAQLLLTPLLQREIEAQQLTCQVVKEYGRAQLRKKIRLAEQQVFSGSSYRDFREKIKALFRKH